MKKRFINSILFFIFKRRLYYFHRSK